jgi:DNA-binding transcriptional MocR family regulator
MDLPIEVINAVKETTAEPKAKPKARKPYVKKLTKRILHAIGNGLRTSTSIANALNVPKAKIQSNMCHLKTRGLVYSSKQVGSLEHKYHLTTDKPVLDKLDLTPKKKARKPYAKRKSVYNEAGVNTTNSFNTPPKPTAEEQALKQDVDRLIQRISNLEVTLTEKEKEVWTLECEVFDKKAIIKYLEEKLFQLGVRV